VAVPSRSTPLAKRQFHGSWKPRYATRPFICHFLYRVCDFNLFSLVYSVASSGRSPASGGGGTAPRVLPKLLSPRTPSKPNRVMRLSVAAGSRLLAWLLPRVPPCRRPPLVGPRPPRCYHEVPLMSQPKRWPLMILLSRLARQGAHVSPLKWPTTAAPWSLRSPWGTARLGPPGMSPSMRLFVRLAGHLPRPRTCSTGRVVALLLWASMLKERTTVERARVRLGCSTLT
jgi:hypothetical protein